MIWPIFISKYMVEKLIMCIIEPGTGKICKWSNYPRGQLNLGTDQFSHSFVRYAKAIDKE